MEIMGPGRTGDRQELAVLAGAGSRVLGAPEWLPSYRTRGDMRYTLDLAPDGRIRYNTGLLGAGHIRRSPDDR